MGGGVGNVEELKVRVVQGLAVDESRAFPHLMENPRALVATELAGTITLEEVLLVLEVRPQSQGLSSKQSTPLLLWN